MKGIREEVSWVPFLNMATNAKSSIIQNNLFLF